jgi:hypothetical protein
MKILKQIFIPLLMMAVAISCQKGIDPISYLAPGDDTASPVVKINYPTDVTVIRDEASKVPIKIQCEAVDDIELASIVLKLDGVDIQSFSSFIDYRRAVESYIYDGVSDGTHTLTVTATDLAGKTGTQTVTFSKTTPYHPLYDGEVFYMPFDGDFVEQVNNIPPDSLIGAPGFVDGKIGKAYVGFPNSYIGFKTSSLPGIPGTEFSTAFWYNLNAVPDRAGILEICRQYTVFSDTTRYKGFRLFREANGTKQNISINFGLGKAEVWSLSPFTTIAQTGNWIHIAVSFSATTATIYVNNQVVKTLAIANPIDWTDCNYLSIMSGRPYFAYWTHMSDLSQMDELRIFNKAITADEVAHLYAAK